MRRFAIESIAENSDSAWIRYIELCVLTSTFDRMLHEVTSKYFATISSVFSELMQIDSSITNAWSYLWQEYDFPDYRAVKIELSPIFTDMTLGTLGKNESSTLAVSKLSSDISQATLAMTFVRCFLIHALQVFDNLGAFGIRQCFQSRVSQKPLPNIAETPDRRTMQEFVPECPICKSRTVLRYSKRGHTPGKAFWGCTRFPDCRGTLSLFKSADRYPQFDHSDEDQNRGDWFVEYMNELYGPDWDD